MGWRQDSPVQVLAGHEGLVYGAVFSPDGSTVLSFSLDETVRLWDAATERELRSFSGHNGSVLDAAFSHNGKRIVSPGDDFKVRVWDVDSGKQELELPAHATTAAFSRDDKMVVTGAADGSLSVWDAASGTRLGLYRHGDFVNSVSFSPAGDLILSVSDDQTAKVYPCEICGDRDDLLALAEERLRYVREPNPRARMRDPSVLAQRMTWSLLSVGDCLDGPEEGRVWDVQPRACSDRHDEEVFAILEHPAGPDEPFDEERVQAWAEEQCSSESFARYFGSPFVESDLLVFGFLRLPRAGTRLMGWSFAAPLAQTGPRERVVARQRPPSSVNRMRVVLCRATPRAGPGRFTQGGFDAGGIRDAKAPIVLVGPHLQDWGLP